MTVRMPMMLRLMRASVMMEPSEAMLSFSVLELILVGGRSRRWV